MAAADNRKKKAMPIQWPAGISSRICGMVMKAVWGLRLDEGKDRREDR